MLLKLFKERRVDAPTQPSPTTSRRRSFASSHLFSVHRFRNTIVRPAEVPTCNLSVRNLRCRPQIGLLSLFLFSISSRAVEERLSTFSCPLFLYLFFTIDYSRFRNIVWQCLLKSQVFLFPFEVTSRLLAGDQRFLWSTISIRFLRFSFLLPNIFLLFLPFCSSLSFVSSRVWFPLVLHEFFSTC